MASSEEAVFTAKKIVDPLFSSGDYSANIYYPPVRMTAYLLIEPVLQGLADPEADDFTAQALNAIQGTSNIPSLIERASCVLTTDDSDIKRIILSACLIAKSQRQPAEAING